MDKYAVIGNPIKQSMSPDIHAAFANETGQDMEYGKLFAEVDGFKGVVDQFFADGARGLNVTAPFKLDAFEYADELTERARTAGAVNTLALQGDGTLLGDNTDGAGLVSDIKQHLGWVIRGKRVLILGAGGATRGTLLPLLEEKPAELHIANRTAQKARQLAEDFSGYGSITASGLDAVPDGFELIINASAASLSGELPPLSPRALAEGCCAYDMVYGAQPTPFMHWATGLGAEVSDGLGMLVGQAAESFALWRGVRPRVEPVLGMLRERLLNKPDSEEK
ncbi:shikimate dehydrogenase [Microbulbifer hydrolyticus]|uniref:Shikimate dehydrogenase (NADP(+)) n=1 Tax=Microbulbifer hydrolyticus TaxID=48074 RepID=A0A6P1THC7_9GAMM|nr:shikimate dehydrogenase [Microbulbifer hydrolyticus]MBB5211787.1 shikimate dehydrogenase [Microbulbifer hydrolyticus]QHQ40619.1 shikimate dehydrogenase [Microbulbifer hydrolyticus]